MITQIQSISDIITNSSSEVFVLDNAYYDYCELIDMNWLIHHSNEWEMICNVFNLEYKELSSKYYYGCYLDPTEEEWESFLKKNGEVINKRLKDKLYWVEIWDNDTEELENARSKVIWMDSRY